jgi:hypothetical protein
MLTVAEHFLLESTYMAKTANLFDMMIENDFGS